jgi:predicted enzyme related to lactoylglutathione lyase
MSDSQGRFVWYELMTTDMKAAGAFYSAVVGWATQDSGMTDIAYTLFTSGPGMVAGLMMQPEESRKMGAPPSWMGYIAVDDVDAATGKVKRLGGKAYVEPRDIPNVGRFSVVADPQMAVFALFKPIPPPNPPAEPPAGTPGQIGWRELYASDWEKAFAFYSDMFGWKKDQSVDMGAMGTYQLFAASSGPAIGGMFNKPAQVPATFWLYYFNVDGIDAGVERVKAAGGKVVNGPMEVPGGSHIVQCMDPQGAMFALVAPRK